MGASPVQALGTTREPLQQHGLSPSPIFLKVGHEDSLALYNVSPLSMMREWWSLEFAGWAGYPRAGPDSGVGIPVSPLHMHRMAFGRSSTLWTLVALMAFLPTRETFKTGITKLMLVICHVELVRVSHTLLGFLAVLLSCHKLEHNLQLIVILL